MLAAIHYIGQFIRVIFVFQFVDLHRVKIKHVNELRQFLDLHNFVAFSRPRIFFIENGVSFLVVMLCHYRHQHLKYLVSRSLTLEICEEHTFENIRGDETLFVFNILIQLLAKII
jgi:hypothetical protein